MIGWEREIRHQPAGLRAHVLVGSASAVYCLITLAIVALFEANTDAVRTDPVRMVEGSNRGVVFLVAGMIVFTQGKVRGLIHWSQPVAAAAWASGWRPP